MGAGRRAHRNVHTLVMETFVGPRPAGTQCAHLNGVRTDARLVNLAWKTPAENDADKDVHGTRQRGSLHGGAKLSEQQVATILSETGTCVAIAKKYGVDPTTVSLIRNRKTWTHVQPEIK